jgi:Flp pilus assembly protein TadG
MATRKRGKTAGGFLSRLRHDQSGNIIAITAAAVLPMIAVVGGAVDMSRIYMTKARLQAACDAGALAGRKAMPATTYTTAAKARADAMFNFNFKPADYEATLIPGDTVMFTSSANAQGALTGQARTRLPTVLMKIFGKTSTDLSVTCGADLQVPNIDIVMVLDVTGSMDDKINGTKKIDSLKASVKSFYTTIKGLVPTGSTSQIRYGFVPYSQAVNGSGLFKVTPDATKGELPLSHIVDAMSLPTRVANFNTPVAGGNPTVTATTTDYETYVKGNGTSNSVISATSAAPSSPSGTPMSYNDCTGIDSPSQGYARNNYFSIDGGTNSGTVFDPNPSGSPIYLAGGSYSSSVPSTYPYQKITYSLASNHSGQTSNGTDPNTYRICTRKRVIETISGGTTVYKFTNWTYKNVNFNVSQFKQGTAINYVSDIDSNYTVPTSSSYDMVQLRQLSNQSGLSSASTTWNGCLEERTTVAAANFAPIPTGAKDLNYIDGGTDDTLRWRPVLQSLAWMRDGPANETTTDGKYQPGHSCPATSMRNLQVMTQAQVDAYADTLSPNGYTYLDAGLIWGLRMISPQGMFASRNITGPNGGQIQRYVIFMTDGEPVSQGDTYSSYGLEQIDQRIAGGGSLSAAALHAKRFQALCDTQTGSGAANLFVVGFGNGVTPNLKDCVGGETDRFFAAANASDLTAAFNNIANEIADLRLVQ